MSRKELLQKKLSFLILLMSLALVGLVGIQFYWIRNAVEENRVRFQQQIHEALNVISTKLERLEVLEFAKQQGYLDDKYNFTSLNHRFSITGDASGINFHSEVSQERINSLEKHAQGSAALEQLRNFEFMIRREMALRPQTLSERLGDGCVIDSLIQMELQARGINKIQHDYLVLDRHHRKILLAEYAENKKEVLSSPYNILLYPNDMRGTRAYLYLDFPNEENYLVSQMWAILASSVIFLGIIIFSFATAIMTILKQKKSSEVTNDFINNMTHEFKTPISTISLATEFLADPAIRQLPTQSSRYLGMIKDECTRLSGQVEKVLQAARLERQDFKLKLQEVEVNYLLEKSANHIQLQVEQRGGRIEVELDKNAPKIVGDQVHLSNIFANLLDNANKYSPEKPYIKLSSRAMRKGLRITIKDNGLGISKEDQNHIFEKFFRVHTGNVHDVKGFGLGLSYVKRVVEAHQGSIRVQSELGKGSTFILLLPYTQLNDTGR